MKEDKVKNVVDFMNMRVNPVDFVNAYNKYGNKQVQLSDRLRKTKQMKVTKLILEIAKELNKEFKEQMQSKKGGAELFNFTNNDNMFYFRDLNPPATNTSLMNDYKFTGFTTPVINTYNRI